ncbi:hypothetical protein [uncultured Croceitalea sp.]|uniref:hypothetical protein n=1 Tax=uncultured Croceitalea sp. TaxID=1798908 RepID=UPI00330688FF
MRRLQYIGILSFLFLFSTVGPTIHLVAFTDWDEVLMVDFNEEEKNTSEAEKENGKKELFNYFLTDILYAPTSDIAFQSKSISSKKMQIALEIILPPPKHTI